MTTAFHDDQQFRSDFIAELQSHHDADMLVKKTYGDYEDGEEFRGCHIGCAAHSLTKLRGKVIATDDHEAVAAELGWPEWLARLCDAIFEGLPNDEAMLWPMRITSAVRCGAEITDRLRHAFCHWLLTTSGLLAITDVNREAIAGVASLCERAARGEEVTPDEWSAAWSAAWSAESAAWSAAWSEAWWAESAAWSARSAAESAAESAESAESARSAAWNRIADKVVELISAL